MNFRGIKNTVLVLAVAGTFLAPSVKAEAAELSNLVSAGVTATMEQVEDVTVLEAATSPSVVEGYTLLGVVNAEKGYINIREEMSTDCDVVGKIRKDAICEVVSIEDEWCEIESGEIKGYISSEYLLTGEEANEKAQELMEEGVELETAITMMEYRYGKGVTDIQMEICEYARQFVGNPYKWGGTSLTNGADCSGFVQSVFANFGIYLSRTAASQSGGGTAVSLDSIQAGDLLFYDNGGYVGHVAIYCGDGTVVHASNEKTGITISDANYRTPVSAKRYW